MELLLFEKIKELSPTPQTQKQTNEMKQPRNNFISTELEGYFTLNDIYSYRDEWIEFSVCHDSPAGALNSVTNEVIAFQCKRGNLLKA